MKKGLWIEKAERTQYEKLEGEESAEVVVIGGGISGLTTAYLLKKQGINVKLLEGNKIAYGTSGKNTGKITSLHSLCYQNIKTIYGKEFAFKYGQGNEKGIQIIKDIVRDNNIQCDLEIRDSLVYTLFDENLESIYDEVKITESIALPSRYTDKSSLPFDIKGGIIFNGQAMFNPRKYLLGLGSVLNAGGKCIYENSRVIGVEKTSLGYKVMTDEGFINCKKIVVATHGPIFNKYGLYFVKSHGSTSYIIAIKGNKIDTVNEMSITVEKPKKSIRTVKIGTEEYLLIAGEENRTGEENIKYNPYNNLLDFGKMCFGNDISVKYQWETEDIMTLDGIPYIGNYGKDTEDIYVITGLNKWGITNGTIGASIICDDILGKENIYKDVFSAQRFETISSITPITKNVATFSSNFIDARIDNADKTIEDIEKDSGDVISYKGEKAGVYKDKNGKCYIVDVVCPHLGCELTFNKIDKTWDCPCHGSRFTIDGKIIEAPTKEPLKLIEIIQL